jgi:plastocyanin domain-containing protein
MKSTSVSIIIVGLIIAGAILLTRNVSSNTQTDNIANYNSNSSTTSNVSVVDGKQIIEIRAKGGYTPSKSIAKAGIPTTLRFITEGAFDCSASIRIQSMNILKLLPQTGATDIDLGNPETTTLNGTCGMGMYSFAVDFK